MTKFSSPVPKGSRFTSGFMTRARPNHAGDDWAPPKPGTRGIKITAVADGTVTSVGTNIMTGHSGKAVRINHGIMSDKYGSDKMESYYGHLASYSVKVGAKVKAGQVIGVMGETGNVTGIHLHLGVLCNGRWIAPTAWLGRKGVTIGEDSPVKSVSVYTVKGGDTLSGIAVLHNTTVANLIKLNKAITDKNKHVISIGQKITVK